MQFLVYSCGITLTEIQTASQENFQYVPNQNSTEHEAILALVVRFFGEAVRAIEGSSIVPMCRVVLDYTHTELSDPIRVRVLPDGSVDYVDEENVVTLRFGIDF